MIEQQDTDREPDVNAPLIILPPSPFWLLQLHVPEGQCTPFTHMMLWAWQFQRTQGDA